MKKPDDLLKHQTWERTRPEWRKSSSNLLNNYSLTNRLSSNYNKDIPLPSWGYVLVKKQLKG